MPNDFLEKTLEDIIFENKSTIFLRGIPEFLKRTFRQFILPSGKKIDIISFEILEEELFVQIWELKRDVINIDAICQAYDYLWEFMGAVHDFKKINSEIILIGKQYNPISIMSDIKSKISIFTYSYGMDGITFNVCRTFRGKSSPHSIFSSALYAWATGMLHYPEGQPASVNITTGYMQFVASDPSFEGKVQMAKLANLGPKEQLLLPPSTTEWPFENPNIPPVVSGFQYKWDAYDDYGTHYQTNE